MSGTNLAQGAEPRLYNSRCINAYLRYLTLKYPEIDQSSLLGAAGIRPEEVDDQGHWFSQRQINLFYDRLLQLTGNEQIAREAGRHLVRAEASGWFRKYGFGFLTMEQVAKRTRSIAGRISRSAVYEARMKGPRHVEVVVTPYPGVEERSFQCQNRIGSFESFWLHFTLKLPTIHHDECMFSGGKVCRYEILWEDSKVQRREHLRNQVFIALVAASILAMGAMPALAFSLVAPVSLGLLGLLAIFSANQGRRETLEYIETLGDANARALDQIDNDYQSAQLTREIGQVISQSGDIDTTLKLILQSLQRHLPGQRAMLLLLERNHPGWHYRDNFGFSSGAVSRVRNLPMMLDASSPESLASFFWQNSEPLVLGAKHQSCPQPPEAALSLQRAVEAETLVLCPIAADGELLGVLLVDHGASRRPLESSDLNRLMSVAPIIGVAICNARLIGEMADHQAQVTAQVEDRTAELREALKIAHELAQRAEAANLAKSQFLANISHEVRTPLIGVLGMNELLLQSDLTDPQRELAVTVQSSGETLLELLNDILDFSRIEAGRLTLEQVDFALLEAVEQAVVPLAETIHGKDLELVLQLAALSGLSVAGDPRRLRQVLVNLVGNALKFTPKGEVVLSAELLQLAERKVTVRFTVRDTGIGISAAAQQTIFNSFSQADNSTSRQYGGSGLGLAIVQQLVTLMGGSLGLESELGRGSCFWVTLPLDLVASDGRTSPDLRDCQSILLTASAALAEGVQDYFAQLGQSMRWLKSLSAAKTSLDLSGPNSGSLVLVDLALERAWPGSGLAQFCSQVMAAGGRVALVGARRDCQGWPAGVDRGVESLHKPVQQGELLRLLQHPGASSGFAAPISPAPLSVPESSPCLRPSRILVVEDNAITRDLVAAMMMPLGCHLTMADSGEQALACWGDAAFDLVLMDCLMPGIDGYQTTAQLRDAGCRAPIVALTARAQRDDLQRCLDAGMDDYLSKPFKQKDLLAMIQRWLPQTQRAVEASGGGDGVLL